jgi:hypothetical protein
MLKTALLKPILKHSRIRYLMKYVVTPTLDNKTLDYDVISETQV